MNVTDVISYKYPGIQGIQYWYTQYDGAAWDNEIDGLVWNNAEIKKPTWDQLLIWEQEYLNNKNNQEHNQVIYKQLEEIDLKSIRALRTNDVDRLAEYEQQAVALRAQLVW